MLELVIGSKGKAAIRNLISELKSLDLNGTLYLGYPILATPDETILALSSLPSQTTI